MEVSNEDTENLLTLYFVSTHKVECDLKSIRYGICSKICARCARSPRSTAVNAQELSITNESETTGGEA